MSSSSTLSTINQDRPAGDLVDLGDGHGDWKVVGEFVLIDRLAHSAEWDWLGVDTWVDHGRRFEDFTLAGNRTR